MQALQGDLQILQEERDSLSAQLELALAKAESEELARSIAEEQITDLEKEKAMFELEIKEINAKHKADLSDKDNKIIKVYLINLKPTYIQAKPTKTIEIILVVFYTNKSSK